MVCEQWVHFFSLVVINQQAVDLTLIIVEKVSGNFKMFSFFVFDLLPTELIELRVKVKSPMPVLLTEIFNSVGGTAGTAISANAPPPPTDAAS